MDGSQRISLFLPGSEKYISCTHTRRSTETYFIRDTIKECAFIVHTYICMCIRDIAVIDRVNIYILKAFSFCKIYRTPTNRIVSRCLCVWDLLTFRLRFKKIAFRQYSINADEYMTAITLCIIPVKLIPQWSSQYMTQWSFLIILQIASVT